MEEGAPPCSEAGMLRDVRPEIPARPSCPFLVENFFNKTPNTPKPRGLAGPDQTETPPTPCCYSMVIPDLKFKNSGLQLGVARKAESLDA